MYCKRVMSRGWNHSHTPIHTMRNTSRSRPCALSCKPTLRTMCVALFALLMLNVLCATTTLADQAGCGLGPCGETHTGPGCVNMICCGDVCAFIPRCCETNWDAACLDMANQQCEICGIPGLGSCFISHQKAACADATCCALVCQIYPYCCDTMQSWDYNCAFNAQELCVLPPPKLCGDPDAGSCLVPHGNSSCSDKACCEMVCSGLSSCCDVIWDELCVSVAQDLCNSTCTLVCPSGAIQEIESCGARTNDPLIRPDATLPNVPQTITLAVQAPTTTKVCGKLFTTNTGTAVVDVDVYAIDLRNADTDQDGFVKVAISLSAVRPVFAALTPVNSTETALPGALVLANAAACNTGRDWNCVAPAKYWVVIAPGTNGIISSQAFTCDNGAYWFQLETAAACALPCTNATGSCTEIHGTPSCVNPVCCSLVCASIASCCETSWDQECAILAAQDCGAPTPSNDACANAIVISTGSTTVSLLGSTSSLPAFSCPANTAPTGGDVWLRWENPTGTHRDYKIDTCGVSFDTRMDIFTGSCGALALRACSDNSVYCNPIHGSSLVLSSECGESYFIRIASLQGETGFATIHITALSDAQSCCPEDLDFSGTVDSGDIGMVLLDTGPCLGCPTDLDGSGQVDSGDVGIVLLNSGPCQ